MKYLVERRVLGWLDQDISELVDEGLVVPVEEPVYKLCPDGEFGDNMDECETCHGIGFVEIGDTE